MSAIVEFFGFYTKDKSIDWRAIVEKQFSKYTGKKSIKVRKSQPEIAIGTVVIRYGKEQDLLIIDPERFLEGSAVFKNCVSLLELHEPTNDLVLIPEVKIPGGNVDFFLVSVKDKQIIDFVGIELQALDTTGSLWGERQKLLIELGLDDLVVGDVKDMNFGINWKMTAKTTLVQLHHKLETFEHLNKKFVLVLQDKLLDYMQREFNFKSFKEDASAKDSMHIHSYSLSESENGTVLHLAKRISTDKDGLSESLGLMAEAKVELEIIHSSLIKKMENGSGYLIK